MLSARSSVVTVLQCNLQAVSNVNLLAGAIVAGMPSALTGALAQYMEGEP